MECGETQQRFRICERKSAMRFAHRLFFFLPFSCFQQMQIDLSYNLDQFDGVTDDNNLLG